MNVGILDDLTTVGRIETYLKEEERASPSDQLKPLFVRLANQIEGAKRGLRKRLNTNSELEKGLKESAIKRPR